ncbi:anthranilate synthase component I family protein [Streptomyces botrytidirepellens]|uniref:Anthranilate synthase component I family protein n=1 Tax=Streptomyces botrytidirepellens TaxID=2486417 RepID=A0A3M8STI0_9ACTN|nr:anthranilate synthase component I family protein [Streptomyces botrytidirepellens]RNF84005.1 anthranilate synthase component I family protein [Streptomyces botrytidirepellens]
MARSAPIHVRVTASGLPAHDPLDLYEELRRTHPADDVFLLENASRTGRDPDRAVVGCGRLLDIRVLGGGTREVTVRLRGEPALVRALLEHAGSLGLRRAAAPLPDGGRELRAELGVQRPEQLWAFLEAARSDLFEVRTDLSPQGWSFGFLTSLAYESTWHMEDLGERAKPPRGPDVTLTVFRHTVWYDRTDGTVRELRADSSEFGARHDPGLPGLAREAARRAGVPPVPEAPRPLSVRDSVDRATFLRWADRCLEHIRVGDIYQIQIGHRVDVRTELAPEAVYRRLRARNPSPYMYLAPRGDTLLIGASPELFFRVEDGEITMRPIAGTAPRGADEEENQQRVKQMRESTKEQAEHIMLVDLCRNDIGRVCRPGTLPVDQLMEVETYSHVFHLVSTVKGRLAEGVTAWDAVRATFPAGTMTGAPKIRAMEIIDELEREPRGGYAGAVGLLDVRGWSELALCIRTIEYDGVTYSTQSSAGLVAQSEPEAEWRETLAKMGAAHWALTGEELLP